MANWNDYNGQTVTITMKDDARGRLKSRVFSNVTISTDGSPDQGDMWLKLKTSSNATMDITIHINDVASIV